MPIFEINITISGDKELLESLHLKVDQLTTKVNAMSEIIDRLAAEVEENKTVMGSAVALISNLVEEVRNAPNMTAVAALADTLSEHTDALAAFVAANTPGAPAPEQA